jgi:hypothetical protein
MDSTEFIVTMEKEQNIAGYTNTMLVLGIGEFNVNLLNFH